VATILARYRIQVNGYLGRRISSKNLEFQAAPLQRILTLPLRLSAAHRAKGEAADDGHVFAAMAGSMAR
jgi:hypothetical protein